MKKILYIFATVVLLAACTDDGFLDKKPLDKLSEEDVFSNASLIEAYVNSFYAVFPDFYQEGNVACITDEAFFRYGGTSTNYIARGLMTADNVMYMEEGGSTHNSRTTTLNIWNRSYTYIRNMNDFFAKVEDNSVLEDGVKKRLMGEVYFLRAWTYFNLIQRYGGVPIITKLYDVGDDYTIERSSFDTCVDFILEDLTKAKAMLPDKADELGRVSRDAALALESRLTLTAASLLFNDPAQPDDGLNHGAYSADKWQRALTASKAIIDRIDTDLAYELAGNYNDFWTNRDSKEVIWAKYFNVNSGNKAQLLYTPPYLNGWIAVQPTEAIACDFEMAATSKKIFEEGSGYNPAKPWEGRDPRFYLTVCQPNGMYCDSVYNNMFYYGIPANGKYVSTDAYTSSTAYDSTGKFMSGANDNTGYCLKKFVIEGAEISESVNTTIMQPWFRVAEMYLNYAEACYRTNDEATCRTYINKVRARVGMLPISDSGLNLWDRLVQERRIELCFENGFRYFDLRRWKLAPFYENVPTIGVKTLAFYIDPSGTVTSTKGTDYTDNYGNSLKVVYRTAEKYDATVPASSRYDFYSSWLADAQLKNIDFTDPDGRRMSIHNYVVTYSWLGQEYKIDYGNCYNPNMNPQKSFPERQYFMPIPSNEITKSNKVLVQNPGY